MIRQLKMWWYMNRINYCMKRAYQDWDDNHFDGHDRWVARAEAAGKKWKILLDDGMNFI